MEFQFVVPDLRRLDETSAELVACAIWKDEWPMRGLGGLLDWRLAGKFSRLAREGFLMGELGEVLFVPGRPRLAFDKVLVLGLGARTGFGDGAFRQAFDRFLSCLDGLRVRRAVLELPGRADDTIDAERATELVLERLGEIEAHDALYLVEPPEAQKRIALHALDERRRSRHG